MVRLFDMQTGAEQGAFDAYGNSNDDRMTAMLFLPDGQRLATGSDEKKDFMSLRIWDVATGNLVHVIGQHTGSVHGLAWSSDGRFLASAADSLHDPHIPAHARRRCLGRVSVAHQMQAHPLCPA